MSREWDNLKTYLLKLGVVVTVSCSGYLFSRHRTRRIKASRILPPILTRSSVDSRGARVGPEDDDSASHGASTSSNAESCMSEKYMCIEKATVGDTTTAGGENEGLQVNESVKKVDYSGMESPRTFRCVDECEQEIKRLKRTVRMLRERERNLEVQLLEYYGLKEQDKTVMELENRLRISNMEAKLLSLKIESLQADNRRLEAQVSDHAKLTEKLEVAKGKTKLLKKKLRYEAEQNREHILKLQDRVANMKEQEHKSSANDVDVLLKLQKLKDLEAEAEDLRSSNLRLQQENAELGHRLDSKQMAATSALEDFKQEKLKEANDQLKEEKETLSKKIEGLQADKCADVEELVYLRWLNACLRYEMRNHQPPPGNRALALSPNRKASPKSEEKPEKPKKPILDPPPPSEGTGEKAISIGDFDSDRWSTSQQSEFESSLPDESPADLLSSQKSRSSKKKFIDKLKKMIKGKDGQTAQTAHAPSDKDETLSAHSWSAGADAASSSRYAAPARRSVAAMLPLDIPRSRALKAEDAKEGEMRLVNIRPRAASGQEKRAYELSRRASADLAHEMDSFLAMDKAYLAKYSAPFKINSAGGGTPRFCRKSASYSSF